MAKFYGKVGFCRDVEQTDSYGVGTGVWKKEIIERNYYGDYVQSSMKYDKTGNVNDSVNVNNRISIVADDFTCDNLHWIRYIVIRGVKWAITDISDNHPRLILSIGGLYNGQ